MRRLLFAVLLLTAGLAQTFPCQAIPTVATMGTQDIHPGMRGYGRTVFHGTKVESFPVTILGVVRHFLAEQDLILFKIDGGYLKQKGLGIVAGMSGSPVYVNGRLIGAVAYGWSFAKDPVGGITPISAMLKELPGEPASTTETSTNTAPQRLPQPLVLDGQTYRYVALQTFHDRASAYSADTLTLKPAGSMLQLTGWSPHSLAHLQSVLSQTELVPVAAMSMEGPARMGPLTPIEPGSSIGVELVSGDLSMSATGTLTYLDGHRFLAFGHPLAKLGDIHLPLTEAYVFNIYPSAQSPFKIATQLGEIGELSSDRSYAVGGVLGVRAATLPVTLHISDSARHYHKDLHLRVFQHPIMTGPLVSAAMTDALETSANALGPATARIHFELKTSDRAEPLRFSDTETSTSIDESVSAEVASVLQKLSGNDFQSSHIESLSVSVELTPGKQSAVIEKVYTDKSSYEPGETMVVGVEIKPYNQPTLVRSFRLPIPVDAEKGAVKIAVSGGADMAAVRKRLSVTDPPSMSMGDVYRNILREDKNDDLVLTALYTSSGAMVGSERYSFLPKSFQELAAAVNSSALLPDKDLQTQHQTVPWVVSGSQILALDVDLKDNTGYKPAAVIPLLVTASGKSTPSVDTSAHASASKSVEVVKPEGGPDAKVLPSSTRRWLLSDAGFLQRGDLHGMKVSEDGVLTLAPGLRTEDVEMQQVGWSLAASGDTTAIGYGPPGRVVVRHGGRTLEYSLPTAAVTAVAIDAGGTVWAGASRPARLYRLAPDGTSHLVLEADAQYLWTLATDAGGTLYAGTGLPGRVYQLSHGSEPHVLFETPEPHIRSIAVGTDNHVYVGTGNRGLIYDYQNGTPHPLYTSAYGSVDSLIWKDPQTLLAGSGKIVYEISLPTHQIRSTELHTGPVLSMLASGGHWYAGTLDGRLYDLAGQGSDLLEDNRTGPVMALAASGGEVLALHASPAGLSRLSGRLSPSGSWDSPVLDATDPATWGAIRYQQDTPTGSSVQLATRSGDTPVPDRTWSDWSPPAEHDGARHIESPAARYLQLRIGMTASMVSPTVSDVTVFYRPQGRQPHLTINEPGPAEAWSGKHKITWKADEGNHEDQVYDVEVSADGGKTWKPVAMGHHATLKEHGLAPDEKAPAIPEDSVEWDTHESPDGVYQVRITARDLAQRGPGVVFLSPAVTVVNTHPSLEVKTMRVTNGLLRVEGRAKATLDAILEVSYRLDGGDWHRTQPEDGVFDSPQEAFWLEETLPAKKPANIELRVTDEAGNVQSLKKEL